MNAAAVPVTVTGYTAAGNTVSLALNFVPATGTALTVVNNTGADESMARSTTCRRAAR